LSGRTLKKFISGIATPQQDIDLVKAWLKQAETHARENSHE
jgi:hypothetical protein